MGLCAIFATDWGWMGVYVTEFGIRRVVLPRRSPEEISRILKGVGDSVAGTDGVTAESSGTYDEVRLAYEFASGAAGYLKGEETSLSFPVDTRGLSVFQKQVMEAISKIPRGETRSYGELAREIGKPRAARAVGRACAANPAPLVVPCHRVVGSGGGTGGFSDGVALKRRLLELEGVDLG